jgi:hypothetical protein
LVPLAVALDASTVASAVFSAALVVPFATALLVSTVASLVATAAFFVPSAAGDVGR